MLQTVKAAFFGVGAPEAVLVGVVALVVFGPKGLAQVRVVLMQRLIFHINTALCPNECM